MYLFAYIHCGDASAQTPKTSKQIEMNLKCFVKKNIIY